MSKHRVLSLEPQLRLEWRGQDGQNETEQPDHSANLGDSVTSSTRIRFSVHTGMIPAMKAIHVIRIGRMASKNAILIVEFARETEAHGRSVVRAPVEASRPQRRSDARLTRAVQLPCAPDTVGKQQG